MRLDMEYLFLIQKTKQMINEIFAEKLYDVDFEESIDITDKTEKEIYKRIIDAKETLGDDLCVWFIKNKDGLLTLSEILKSYIHSSELKKNKHELQLLLNSVNINNMNAKLQPLVLAAKIDMFSKTSILSIYEGKKLFYVKDLENLLSLTLEYKDYHHLINFIKWLNSDVRQVVKDKFREIFINERDLIIIKKRAVGATFEETAKEIGVTRMRIRQIELNILKRFRFFTLSVKPHYIISAFSTNPTYFKINEIKDVCGELAEIFIYLFKKCDCPNVSWAEKLDGFIIGESLWYQKLIKHSDQLPDMIELSDIDPLVKSMSETINTSIDQETIKSVLLIDHTLTGQVYIKQNVRISQMYLAVLEKYYSEGIKLYDDFEAKRFREYFKKMFGDIKLPDNNRAIDANIIRLTVLCDRGKYISPNRINVPAKLLKKIRSYIFKSDRSIFMSAELFERFKNELMEKSTITNRYFLQGVLKYYYPSEFIYTRNSLKKYNSETTIRLQKNR